jgi:hypothetical protein
MVTLAVPVEALVKSRVWWLRGSVVVIEHVEAGTFAAQAR